MFDWLKFRKKTIAAPIAQDAPQPVVATREQVVADALRNMQNTRDMIGEEKLQKLAELILHKKQTVDDTSPAVQAKKIIASLDKEKLSGLMKLMVQDDQTKH